MANKHKTYYKLSNDAFNSVNNNPSPENLDRLYQRRASPIAEDGSEIISKELGEVI